MNTKPLSFFLCAVALASPLALGCSSSGEETIPGDTPDTGAPVADTGAPVDTGAADTGSAPADAGVQDATIADAATDAATDAGLADATIPDATVADAALDAALDAGAVDAGRTCATANDFEERSCGVCGTQSRLCRRQSDGGLDWATWSFCNGQLDGGCAPGTEPDGGIACGNRCGRQRAVCQTDCTYAFGSCVPAPNAVCDKGGSVWEQADAGCTDPTEGRRRSCLDDCTWGTWSGCEPYYVLRDGGLTASADLVITNDTRLSVVRTFAASATLPRLPAPFSGYTACPMGDTFSSTSTPWVSVTVGNATATPRTVSLWASSVTTDGGTSASVDTVSAVYPTATFPTTEADRRACVGGTNDGCPSGNTEGCASPWSGHVGTNAVVIPSGAVYTFVVQAYSSTSTGTVQLNAKALN
jgi:hypothetical protein